VIAAEFAQELIDLGVLVLSFILTNGPLFVLEKAGQPGEWRVRSDMKYGGQNSVVSNDPVLPNRTSHILDQLYDGGYSAVVDASMYFYQFKTRPENRPVSRCAASSESRRMLGICGPSHGCKQLPALSNKFGLSFIRMLKACFSVLQCTPRANCFWTGFS
jgi:hypothetical protein